LENLRWDTHQSNVDDRLRNDRQPRGTRHHAAVLSETDVAEIFTMWSQGMSQRAIAKAKGVHPETVRKILIGQNWKRR
jgi:hypothetical protein